RKADLGMAPRLSGVSEQSLDPGRLPEADGKAARVTVRTADPVVDGGLAEGGHQPVFLGSAALFFDQVPRRVEAVGREMLVRSGDMEVGSFGHRPSCSPHYGGGEPGYALQCAAPSLGGAGPPGSRPRRATLYCFRA